MAEINYTYYAQFFTATILEWRPLLRTEAFKEIVIDSLRFLVREGRVKIYAFVIMPNHIHLIWQVQDGFAKEKVQLSFLRFTAQQMKFRLIETHNKLLDSFKVNAADRTFQFWERNSLSVDLWSGFVFCQKMEYIHNNPVQPKWNLADCPEEYPYSSAKFYQTGIDDFGFLSHYMG